MAIPFDVQKFSGEIVTGIAVFLATQVPKAVRWARQKFSPVPALSELRLVAPRASMRFLSQSTTDAELDVHLEILSVSGRRFELEHFQIHWLSFNNAQLPQVDGKVVPPHVVVPNRGVAEPHIRIRLHTADIKIVTQSAAQASNVYSTPRHNLRLGLMFLAKRRFSKGNVGPVEVHVPLVEVDLPSALIPVSV